MTKESSSVRRTKEAIRGVFLDMIETTPVGEVSVRDICDAVQVSRTTFYRYYADVYALLADCFRTYCSGPYVPIPAEASNEEFSRMLYESNVVAAERVRTYRTLYIVSVDCTDPAFRQEFESDNDDVAGSVARELLTRAGAGPDTCAISHERAAQLCVDLQTRLFVEWAREGCKETPEQIAHIINNCCVGFAHAMKSEGNLPYRQL